MSAEKDIWNFEPSEDLLRSLDDLSPERRHAAMDQLNRGRAAMVAARDALRDSARDMEQMVRNLRPLLQEADTEDRREAVLDMMMCAQLSAEAALALVRADPKASAEHQRSVEEHIRRLKDRMDRP
ncbi:hypothetical protein [Actinoalloteichus hymeniacidonis]|uniref:Uncharacterized protein n=1 Tax=Actinoalloteichus hymeniacidonis TaxID=340345 RepID=A0AAC9MWR6_9PSEU|nr:hypothetical protein [Actinoalloteichus hymeniacidonis]AOS61424.1 hypothetical protein TL08_02950 [Actinoalloteichus hymeniacidonis]MBB5910570.1 negative regulator of replication initiation [Actinoalloteichus hymeniacidonis]